MLLELAKLLRSTCAQDQRGIDHASLCGRINGRSIYTDAVLFRQLSQPSHYCVEPCSLQLHSQCTVAGWLAGYQC
jgi:hypothetical protein